MIRTDHLTGNRIPLAFQTLEDQLYQTVRQSALVRPADEGLPDLLQFFTRTLAAPDLDSVVDSCAEFLELDWNESNSGTLLASLYRNLLHEDDTEGYVVTTGFFVRMIEPQLARLDARSFVLEVVRRYLRSVSYLYPLLYGYSHAALSLARSLEDRPFYLFLRDALVFWPALSALRSKLGKRPLNFLIYTRSLSKAGLSPLIYEETDHGVFQLARGSRIHGMLVDVGLYGTLIQQLDKDDYLANGSSVYFLGSRNPHLPGFLNQVFDTTPSEAASPLNSLDIVNYIDTIECLLKPFLIDSLRINQRFTALLGMCDFISFACFSAFCWDLFHFAHSRPTEGNSALTHMQFPVPGEDSWYLTQPIPVWSRASAFLKRWNTNHLLPANQIHDLFQNHVKTNCYDFA